LKSPFLTALVESIFLRSIAGECRLSGEVDIDQLSAITHGFVGADLAALCREAAMACLRTLLDDIDFSLDAIPYHQLIKMRVTMADFMSGFQMIEPSAIREVFVEVPSVRWDEVGGLEDVKQLLREAIIWPLTHAEYSRQAVLNHPRDLLLAGPPGCGKTTLAKAAATESCVNFISIKGPELLSKFVGESEKQVREIFSKARQAAPCIIFFDEIDGLCATRQATQNDSGVANRILSQFLAEMDGIEELSGVFVLAATNRPDAVDPALKRFGRFEQTLEIGIPSLNSRLEILQIHLLNKTLAESVDIQKIAVDTDRFSGADIAAVCNDAARRSIRRFLQDSTLQSSNDKRSAETPKIEVDDLRASIIAIKQSKEVKNGQ
jgi:transitional endoplasmic reticulum ATPase